MMAARDAERQRELLAQMATALHDMCQPLTALQCRLEVGRLEEAADGGAARVRLPDALWTECLRECHRLSLSVMSIRSLLQQTQIEEQGGKR